MLKHKSTLIILGIFLTLVAFIGGVTLAGMANNASAQTAPSRSSQPASNNQTTSPDLVPPDQVGNGNSNNTTPTNGQRPGGQNQPGCPPPPNGQQTQPGQTGQGQNQQGQQKMRPGGQQGQAGQGQNQQGGQTGQAQGQQNQQGQAGQGQQGTRPEGKPGMRPCGPRPDGDKPTEQPEGDASNPTGSVEDIENDGVAFQTLSFAGDSAASVSLAASRRPAPPQAPVPALSGTVTAINAQNNVFTFKDQNNTEWSVSVTTRTQFVRDGQPASLNDLKVSDLVKVMGRPNQENHSVEAGRVVVGQDNEQRPPRPQPPLRGQVKSVNATANQFVITVREHESNATKDITVNVTAETKFEGYKGLSDLQAGKEVFVGGEKQADNSLTAKVIANRPPRPQSGNAPEANEL